MSRMRPALYLLGRLSGEDTQWGCASYGYGENCVGYWLKTVDSSGALTHRERGYIEEIGHRTMAVMGWDPVFLCLSPSPPPCHSPDMSRVSGILIVFLLLIQLFLHYANEFRPLVSSLSDVFLKSFMHFLLHLHMLFFSNGYVHHGQIYFFRTSVTHWGNMIGAWAWLPGSPLPFPVSSSRVTRDEACPAWLVVS